MGSFSDAEIWEADEALSRMAQGYETVESETLEGLELLNGVPAWPRSTVLFALRWTMAEPMRSPAMLRHLRELRVVTGPHRTSRLRQGKKVNLELWAVNLKAWVAWQEEHPYSGE